MKNQRTGRPVWLRYGVALAALLAAALLGHRLEPALHTAGAELLFAGLAVLILTLLAFAVERAHGRTDTAGDLPSEVDLARLAAIVESSSDAILGQSVDGVILSWNAAAERMYGYTGAEIVGQPIHRLVPTDHQGELGTIYGRVLSGERVEHFETERLNRDGRRFHVSLSISPIRDRAGRIVGLSKIARDISERKQAEAELQEKNRQLADALEEVQIIEEELRSQNEELLVSRQAIEAERKRYEQLFELAPDGYLVTDQEGRILEANRAATELLGIGRTQLAGQFLADFVQEEQKTAFHTLLGMAGTAPAAAELWLRPLGREPFLAEIRVSPGTAAPGNGAAGSLRWLLRDIGPRKRIESALVQANAAKDQFLATLSHELRTPLTPVLAFVSDLAEDPRLPADARTKLAAMRRNVELEARLIDDLLDLTRITHGKLEIKPEVTDVYEVLEHALDICCTPEVSSGKLKVVRDLRAAEHHVWADAPRLTQVFWNLFKNAVKFMPAGGEVRVRATEAPGPSDRRLRIEIADTGIGIDPTDLPRIFDGFEQGPRAITRRFGGLGLGLAISRAIVDLHGGTLEAASAGVDRGATFTLELPLAELPEVWEATALRPAAEARPQEARGTGEALSPRILLVEDHADTAAAFSDLLRASGYDVEVAGGVQEGLAAAHSGRFDLVISDLGLPDGQGHELMRELKSRHGLPGIALSGYGMDEDVRQSREAGFALHLTKPVNLQALKEAIRQVLV